MTWGGALAAFIILAGLESIRLGQDGNWDLKNYHFYNVYAWLNGRLGWDIAPAMIQTYHNPLADLPFYALVEIGARPRVIAFLMAAWTGVAAFFLLRIAAVLFPRGTQDRGLWIGFAVALGVTGAAGRAVIGSTMNEWPSAALLIAALSILVSAVATREGPSWRALALAGVLTGIAVGAKLTYGMFAPALVVALLAFGTPRERLTRAFTLGAFIVAGFLLAYGFWGAALYREFGNPFFPYFNDVFKSPYWQPEAWFDRNYGPRTVLQWIFFPFYFALQSNLVGEIRFRDFRFAALFVLAVACGVAWFARRRSAPATASDPNANAWRLVAVFLFVAYVAWLKMFGIFRYLVPLELLTGPLIVGALLYLLPAAKMRRRAVIVLALVLIAATHKGNWGRLPYQKQFFDVAVPQLPPNSLVILNMPHPMAYIIPFLPADARFVSPSNNFLLVGQDNLLMRRIGELVATHPGPLYSLDFKVPDDNGLALDHYRLERDRPSCREVRSNLDSNATRLCRLTRKP